MKGLWHAILAWLIIASESRACVCLRVVGGANTPAVT